MGTLYLVATPIGNLEDITARALRILREAKLIAAEDTRHSGALLAHFEIHTPVTSYYEHNKLQKLDLILQALREGDVALISDAGMPAINDPGYELIRAALEDGQTVSPVPGASAPLAALTASGLPTDSFLYLGYLPHKSGERKKTLRQVKDLPYTLIFLETPHRLIDALEDLLSELGSRPMCAAREITKLHEEFWRGEIHAALEHFQTHAPRGEFTLVIGGCPKTEAPRWAEEEVKAALLAQTTTGKSAKEIAALVAAQCGWNKKEVYALMHA